jgi:hypothetical protein
MRPKRPKQNRSLLSNSIELTWTSILTAYLTLERKHRRIQLSDYFAALYLASREGLAALWKTTSALDAFVRTDCELGEPIWFYWIELHQAMKQQKYGDGFLIPYSDELAGVLRRAADLALREARATSANREPEMKVEHFLAATVDNKRSTFTRRLIRSGINLDKVRGAICRA